MPKRTDLKTILLIGSGPIVIGQGAEFDYSGTQAVRALREEGYRVVLVNSNPATIMTDPELADRTYIEPVTPEWVTKVIERERPDALLPTMGGQTALNVAMALQRDGTLEKYGVELIGANERAIRLAEDRQEFSEAMQRIGLATPQGRTVRNAGRSVRGGGDDGISGHPPPIVHPGRHRRRHRVQPGGVRDPRAPGARAFAGRIGARRAQHHRMEGIRARGDARRRRQRRHRLLDRESRSHGRAHGRLDHGGARHDAHRPRVSGDARCVHPHHPRDRRGGRRLQHPVRRRPRHRRAARHRDESEGVALVGARLQGDGFPDRSHRDEGGRRLPARRAAQRHHANDAGVVRAGARLCGGQDPALRLREVPRGRSDAHDPDEVGRRGDGDRANVQGSVSEGAARSRDRP